MTVRRRILPATLLALLLALSGCSSVKVETRTLAPADFTHFRSWDWALQDPALLGPYAERIRAAVTKNLTPRGYHFAAGAGDFLIGFGGFTENVLKSGWAKKKPDELGSGIYAEAYGRRQGVLIIEVIDPVTRSAVWRGTARISLILDTPSERMKRIDQAVYHILKELPALEGRKGS